MSYDMSNNFRYNVRWLNRYKNVNLSSGKELTFDGGTIEDGLYILSDFFRETRNKGFTTKQVLEMVGALSLEDFQEKTNFVLKSNHDKLNEAYNECIQELKLSLELDKSKASKTDSLILDKVEKDKSKVSKDYSLKFNLDWITSYDIRELYYFDIVNHEIVTELSSNGEELLRDLKCLHKFIKEGRNLGQSVNHILRRMGSTGLEDFKERTSYLNHSSAEYVRKTWNADDISIEIRSDLIKDYYNDCCQLLEEFSELDKTERDDMRTLVDTYLEFDINWITPYKIKDIYRKFYGLVDLSTIGIKLLNNLKYLYKFIEEGKNIGQSANQILRRMGSTDLEDFKKRTGYINHSSSEYALETLHGSLLSDEVEFDYISKHYNPCYQMLKELSKLDKTEEKELEIFEDKSKVSEDSLLKLDKTEVYKLKELIQEQRDYTPEEINFIKNTIINYPEDIWEKPRNRQSYKELQNMFNLFDINLPTFTGRVASSLENIEEAIEKLKEQNTELMSTTTPTPMYTESDTSMNTESDTTMHTESDTTHTESDISIYTESDTDIEMNFEDWIYLEEEDIWYNEDDGSSLTVEEYNELRSKHSMNSVSW